MKPSQIAKQLLTPEYTATIFEACQQLLNSAPHICVSRKLDEGDTQSIGEVVLESIYEKIGKENLSALMKRTIIHRAKGLFRQWLKQQKETQNG